ncbi:VOC family protein [Sphingopyxis sp. NFH-91]|jgi:catechol 2,3-dioxygenase-like lactoylglutathione lyase family enzyme|uniref:VOC family protein n=1 Tax=Sphingopyxis sp. NFH-91 TaxID=2744457 RepID=UPI001F2EF380|nr:VOC family protein [Sphingopyxis sp. NFH-91]
MMKCIAALALAVTPMAVGAEDGKSPVLAKAQFEQVALTVTDLDAARVFYRDRLGLPLLFEAGDMLFFDVAGTRLMLARDTARKLPERPAGILYFHVDDFTAALGRLGASEAALVGTVETVQSTPAGFLRLQQFSDPDGNMLAIMGFVPR